MDQNRDFVSKLCNLEIPSDIKISPSGNKVLYSTSLTWGHLKGKLPVTTLWLATFGEPNSSKKITDGKYRDHSLAWHPLKDEFAFVSDRAGNATKSAIYTISLADVEKPVSITPTSNEQGIEKFKFSPDGKLIAFISKDEKTKEEKQREENQEDVQVWGQGYKFSRLRVIDLATSEIKTLPLDEHVLDFSWNPKIAEGSEELEIALVTSENTQLEQPYRFGTDIHVVKSDLKKPRKVCSFHSRVNDLSWSSLDFGYNGELHFWSSASANKNFGGNALYKIDIKGEVGEYEKIPLKDNQEVAAVRSVEGRIIAQTQHRLDDCLILVGSEKIYSCNQEIEAYDVAFEVGEEKVRIAIATSDVNHPVEVYSVEGHGDKKVQLSQHGESFRGQAFGTCTTISCLTTDHHEIEIDGIYLEPTAEHGKNPETAPRKPYPTVVLIHGGPHMRITNAFNTVFYMWTPYLLSLGYGVLSPNYRGSTGRGEEFSSFSYGGAGVHEYADVIALTEHAIQKGYADPNRLVVCGYSHGGLLTNLCALRNGCHGHGWKFKAAISGASICDIDTMGLTSDMGNAYQGELHHGNVPWNMSPGDTSTRSSSILWAFKETMDRSKKEGSSIIPPILILHGANDERCPVSQAWGLRRALEHYSLPFEMAIYPRQGHVFHEQYFWIDMALRIGRWVERYIGSGREGPKKQLPVRKS